MSFNVSCSLDSQNVIWINVKKKIKWGGKRKKLYVHCFNIFINMSTRFKELFFFLVCGVLRILQKPFRIGHISLTSSLMLHLQNLPPIHCYPLCRRIQSVISNAILNVYFAMEKAWHLKTKENVKVNFINSSK